MIEFKMKDLFGKKKNAPKTEFFGQVIGTDKFDDNRVIISNFNNTDNIVLSIDNLPDNVFKCSAYKITIEPIEHTFSKPHPEWDKVRTQTTLDMEQHKANMRKMFGLDKEEDAIEL